VGGSDGGPGAGRSSRTRHRHKSPRRRATMEDRLGKGYQLAPKGVKAARS